MFACERLALECSPAHDQVAETAKQIHERMGMYAFETCRTCLEKLVTRGYLVKEMGATPWAAGTYRKRAPP